MPSQSVKTTRLAVLGDSKEQRGVEQRGKEQRGKEQRGVEQRGAGLRKAKADASSDASSVDCMFMRAAPRSLTNQLGPRCAETCCERTLTRDLPAATSAPACAAIARASAHTFPRRPRARVAPRLTVPRGYSGSVSYTHLTLPTILLV